MKKYLIILLIPFSIAFQSKAQTYYGIKAGANIASFRVTGSGVGLTSDSRTAVLAGFLLNTSLTDNLLFQPELIYIGYGGKVLGVELKTDYISLPLVLQYKAVNRFYLEAGLQPGLLATAKSEGEDVKSSFKNFDLPGLVGASFDFTENIGLGIRYAFGLVNVADDSDGSTSKNRGLQIALHVKFK